MTRKILGTVLVIVSLLGFTAWFSYRVGKQVNIDQQAEVEVMDTVLMEIPATEPAVVATAPVVPAITEAPKVCVEVIYLDRPVERVVEKVVIKEVLVEKEKVVYVDRPVIVEKEVLVYREVQVQVPVLVEKVVYKDRPVDRVVYVDREVRVQVPVDRVVYVDRLVLVQPQGHPQPPPGGDIEGREFFHNQPPPRRR